MSLSRKKEDKVNGTGRLHIMKNRYGMDGFTFKADVNTSTGKIEVGDEYDGDNEENLQPNNNNGYNNFDSLDKKLLQTKFFELNT